MKPEYIKHRISNLISIGKIVTIFYFELDKNFHSGGERHDFWEMVYVDKGNAVAVTPKKEVLLQQGEYIFHKPNEFHILKADGDSAPNVFIITFVCSSKAMTYFKNKKGSLPESLQFYISAILGEAEKTFDIPPFTIHTEGLKLRKNAPVGGQQLIRTYLEQLLIQLIRKDEPQNEVAVFPSKESIENHLAAEIMDILKKNLYQSITVDMVCKQVGYSKTYLNRVFKNSSGSSIAAYDTVLKIEEAKRLIREYRYNFSQISDMLQYNNPHYFSRVFKRVTGMSPSEYMHSVKQYGDVIL